MPELDDIGGSIRVVLRPRADRVEAVEIVSSRPAHAARIFEGRPAAEMVAQIGRIFSLCGTAQTVAALDACEEALGLEPAPGVAALRDVLRLSEMLTQTAMRLCLHWPRVLGLPLSPEPVRASLAAEHTLAARLAGADWRAIGAGVAPPPDDAEALVAGLAESVVEAAPVAALSAVLEAGGLAGFGALPEGGRPETGALSRRWSAPDVRAAVAAHGAGLAARLAASAEDLARLPEEMEAALGRVVAAEPRMPERETGTGEAQVDTARGPLTHRVRIVGGIVAGCATFAPTEANFAPDGPVVAGLVGGPPDSRAAELHVLAIDPCVACNVEVADA